MQFVNVDLRPRYNIAPSQTVETILRDGPEKRLGPMKSGFPAAAREEWLDPTTEIAELEALLVPLDADQMEAYPVSTLVNSPEHDKAECVAPIG